MDYIKAFKKYLEEGLDNIDDKEAKMKFKDLEDKDKKTKSKLNMY